MRTGTAGQASEWIQRAVIVLALSGAVLFAYRRPVSWSNEVAAVAAAGRVNEVIPPSYFGLTINSIGLPRPWPDLEFGGVRLWGAIYWAQVNPAPGVYDWKRFDDILRVAEQQQVDVVMNLAFTPKWAAAVKDAPPAFAPGASSPPADMASWEDWVRAAVTRAAGRVKYWEIWNEPEDPKYYSGDVAGMVKMQRRAYEIIKGIDPTLKVLTPPSNGTVDGFRWQSAFLAQGGGRYADIFAFHGYLSAPEGVIGIIEHFRRILTQHGLGALPMWDTEAGWSSWEENQAGCLARAYILKWIYGVDRFFWYEFAGGGTDFGKLWDPAHGLLPAAIAYRTVHKWLVGATVLAATREGRSVWIIELRLADGRKAVALWNAVSTSSHQVGPNFHRYQDLDGREAPIVDGAVQIGPKPILLLEG